MNLGAIDTEQGLHAEGVRPIQGVLHCSVDDARAALHNLRARRQIQETAHRVTSVPIMARCRSRSSVGCGPTRPHNRNNPSAHSDFLQEQAKREA